MFEEIKDLYAMFNLTLERQPNGLLQVRNASGCVSCKDLSQKYALQRITRRIASSLGN